MARSSGLISFLHAVERASAAAQREHRRQLRAVEQERQRNVRETQRRARAAADVARADVREKKELERLQKQQYLEDRQVETQELNSALEATLAGLIGILPHALAAKPIATFDSLRISAAFEAFSPPPELAPGKPPTAEKPDTPSGLARFLPGAAVRAKRSALEARVKHDQALLGFRRTESIKREAFRVAKEEYDRRKASHGAMVSKRNAEIDEFEGACRRGEAGAVSAFFEMLLARSEYPPEGFPQKFRLAYNGSSSELVVEYDMPSPAVVPAVLEHRYNRTRDEIEAKARKPLEVRHLFADVVAAITLRTIHEVLAANAGEAVAVVTFTGILDSVDPANGHDVRVPVISVRAPRAEFAQLRLDKVDKAVCLRNLGANVSARPDELHPVKPIVEFDMVDKRFIDQGDALSAIEARPNLLDLTPSEFETLVANLFGKMGLETKLTRASRDGGVDAVAYDARPVLGGKVVIQAKRYRDTVGVSAVRDLYGTMLNEGATKGILVCTSGYGPDAYGFTKDKPIELIDGGGLLYLLREHAGVAARIVRPAAS